MSGVKLEGRPPCHQRGGQPMNIAVADEAGNLVAHVRMDNAWIGSSSSWAIRPAAERHHVAESGHFYLARSGHFHVALVEFNKAFDLIGVAHFALRKIVEKKIDRSNATVPGDDKIGSRVSWWFAGSARYPSNPSGIT